MTAGTITRRLDSVVNSLGEQFPCACTTADFNRKLDALRAARRTGNRSSRASILSGLFRMLDGCGIPYERGRDDAYYEKLVRNAALPSFDDMEARMLRSLYACYDQYPAPEAYMARIVRSLAGEGNRNEADSVRLRILKQFILAGDYLAGAGYGGRLTIQRYVKEKTGKTPSLADVLAQLDDGVFAVLADAGKAQRRPEGKYGLLKLADDLATGKFRPEGATKEGLYLFAMVFGMTYYSGSGEEIVDMRTDIERNLFRDYYANNLVRFITDAYWGRECEYETDPSGQGINYKNYAEMVYLYYLCRDCTPQEKIKGAGAMIARIRTSRFEAGAERTRPEGSRRTRLFRKLFTEDVLALPEEEFEAFLCQNYDCNTYSGDSFRNRHGKQTDRSLGPMQMETAQESAAKAYDSILRQLEALGLSPEACSYGLWFAEVQELQRKAGQAAGEDADAEKRDRFTRLLVSVDSLLGGATAQTRALPRMAPDTVTRSRIIAAYYYYYNARHEADSGERWKSFAELFRSFKRGVDHYLEPAGYQTLDGRNLFDVLIVFSSYAYLNL